MVEISQAYFSVFFCTVDAELQHFLRAIQWSTIARHDRHKLISDIQSRWMTKDNPNAALPCLSVRTGLDLFLTILNYPPETEIVMSAVNIPDMVHVVHAHRLKVISLDIDLETMAPKMHLLPMLVTDRTKLLLVANIFGRQFDMGPVISAARACNLLVIEDFAEGFHGFDYLGHRDSDLTLFSFGAIKYETTFGGAIAKVRDAKIFEAMTNLNNSWPVQSQLEYLKKVFKCALAYSMLNCPRITHTVMYLTRCMNIDHKKYMVAMLRGFPDRLMERLRHRPCDALLAMMRLRFMKFESTQHRLSNVKHEYIGERLPPTAVQVGTKADIRNHWLCPIMVVRKMFFFIVQISLVIICSRFCKFK